MGLISLKRLIVALIVAIPLVSLIFISPAAAQSGVKADELFKSGKRAYEENKYAAALKILKPLAENGHAEAQLVLGDMYNIGKGVRQDNSQAIHWYRESAAQGNEDAIQMLGQGMRWLGESSSN